jgi:hypothetical protein
MLKDLLKQLEKMENELIDKWVYCNKAFKLLLCSSLLIINQPQFYQINRQRVIADAKTNVSIALLSNETLPVEVVLITAEQARRLNDRSVGVNKVYVITTVFSKYLVRSGQMSTNLMCSINMRLRQKGIMSLRIWFV